MTDFPDDRAGPRRWRLGVLLPGTQAAAWVDQALADLEALPFVELCAAALCRIEAPRAGWRSALSRRYQLADRRVFASRSDPFLTVDVAPRIAAAKCQEALVTVDADGVHRLDPEDAARLAAQRLDVLVAFAGDAWAGEALSAARLGCWWFVHADPEGPRPEAPLFAELRARAATVGSALLGQRARDSAPTVLRRSWSAVDAISLTRGREPVAWKTARLLGRALRALHEEGALQLAGARLPALPPRRSAPGNAVTLGTAAALLARFAGRRLRMRVQDKRWHVGLRPARPFDPARFDPRGFEPLPMPPGRFYADPFLFERAGERFLFFEDADARTEIGSIACCRIDAQGRPEPPQRVLERDYHLSYPFVFEHDGEVWMIPESAEKRRIELYRAAPFPWRWELERVLVDDVNAVDATLLAHGGRHWLFAGIGERGVGTCDELFLFHADSPLGPWLPHPRNPIVSDVRRARPAGRIFRHEGALLRPSQDCSRDYGWGIRLQRIEVLTEQDYAETEVGVVEPGWFRGCCAVHTLDRGSGLETLDWRAWRPRGRSREP